MGSRAERKIAADEKRSVIIEEIISSMEKRMLNHGSNIDPGIPSLEFADLIYDMLKSRPHEAHMIRQAANEFIRKLRILIIDRKHELRSCFQLCD